MNKVFACLLILVIGLSSCSKKLVTQTTPTTPPKPELNVEEIDFGYFHGKARLVLRDANKEREVKANIRVRKDSVIWMTFSVIGVQGGKALINKDSITVVNNVDNEYFVFDYKELSARYNFEVNYEVVEAAMLGNLIQRRQPEDEILSETSHYLLKQNKGTVIIASLINMASRKIEKVDFKETNSSNSLVMNYSNFQPVGDKLFPYNGTVTLYYKTPAGILNTTIIFEYSKAEVGTRELNFPFNIPKRYARR